MDVMYAQPKLATEDLRRQLFQQVKDRVDELVQGSLFAEGAWRGKYPDLLLDLTRYLAKKVKELQSNDQGDA